MLDVCVIIPFLIFLCLSAEKGAIIPYGNVEDTDQLKLYQDRHRPSGFLKEHSTKLCMLLCVHACAIFTF